MVQVTKVDVDDDAITLQLNDGLKKKGSWRDRIQISLGGVTTGPANPQASSA